MAVLAHQAWALDSSPGNEILAAYANMQYIQARSLADKSPKLAEARLVKALCAVFARRKQDLAFGIPELKKIYDDANMKPAIRLEAGLAYARAVQTLRMRPNVYPAAGNVDFNKIYGEIIKQNPTAPAAVFAAVYMAQGFFDSGEAKVSAQGFAILNDILKNFRGPKAYLSAVHYMLADQYIINGRQYAPAVKHLEAAREIGIANPRNRESISFRIARIYDYHLHRQQAAELNYQRFLKEFPNSAQAPVARRFLADLKSAKKETGNG